jgi:hypothetical protein
MADSTTPNYGLILPEVGGSVDTWGDKLNGNTTELDDILIAKPDVDGGIEVTGLQVFSAGIVVGDYAITPDGPDLLISTWAEGPGIGAALAKLEPDGTLTARDVVADPSLA